MSVTFHLYKPVHVEYKWGRYYSLSSREMKELDEQLRKIEDDDEFEKFWTEHYDCTYSDDKGKYDTLNLMYAHDTRNKRCNRYVDYMKEHYKDYIVYAPYKAYRYPYIVVEELCYAQGWFLTREFFRRDYTEFMTFTKESMIRLIHKYVESDKWHVFDSFVEQYEDGMIFIISF